MGFSDKQMRALARSVPARHSGPGSGTARNSPMSRAGTCSPRPTASSASMAGTARPSRPSACSAARPAAASPRSIRPGCGSPCARPSGTVIRDGHGTGEAHGGSAGEVHDRALKAAETDATKRALATFGKAFGLALYAGGAASTGPTARPRRRRPSGASLRRRNPPTEASAPTEVNAGSVTSTLPSPDGTAGNGQSDRVARRRAACHRCDCVGGCHSARVNWAASERVLRHHQRPYPRSAPIHRQECPASSRATPRPRQGASPLRRVAALPALQRHALRRPSRPLRPATRHGPQGRRRVHRPALPRPSSRTPPQRQRSRLVARHGHRSARDRAGTLGRDPWRGQARPAVDRAD